MKTITIEAGDDDETLESAIDALSKESLDDVAFIFSAAGAALVGKGWPAERLAAVIAFAGRVSEVRPGRADS